MCAGDHTGAIVRIALGLNDKKESKYLPCEIIGVRDYSAESAYRIAGNAPPPIRRSHARCCVVAEGSCGL